MKIPRFQLKHLTLVLAMISSISAAVAMNHPSTPDDYRKTPNAVLWINKVSKAEDKASVWIEAAEEGDAYVRWIAAGELGELHDRRAIPILTKLMNEPYESAKGLPHYQGVARTSIELIEAHDYWKNNVETRPTDAEKLQVAKEALLNKNVCISQKAFNYLKEHDKPQSVVQTLLDAYAKTKELHLAGYADQLIGEYSSEAWAMAYAQKALDLGIYSPLSRETDIGMHSATLIGQAKEEKRWKSLFGEPKTPEEIKAAALKVLTTAKHDDYDTKRRAIDYLIDSKDPSLLPVWIENMYGDSRVYDKIVKMGKPVVPELIKRLKQLDRPEVVDFSILALGEIGDTRAIEPIGNVLLADLPPKSRLGAFTVDDSARHNLVKFGKRAIPVLKKVLNSNNTDAAHSAALAMIDMRDKSVLPALKARIDREKARKSPDKGLIDQIDLAIDLITKGIR